MSGKEKQVKMAGEKEINYLVYNTQYMFISKMEK